MSQQTAAPQQMRVETPNVTPELIAKFRREIQHLLPNQVHSDASIIEALGIHGQDANAAVNFLLEKVQKQDPGAGKASTCSNVSVN
jgi:hypothetical protein